jgi:hypothetical protein
MSGVGPTVFLLPSSSVGSMCSACAGKGGMKRRTGGKRLAHGRKEAGAPCSCSRTPARAAERRGRKEASPLPLPPPTEVRSPHARRGPCSSRAAAPSRSPWPKLLSWCRGVAALVGFRRKREGREPERGK